MSIPWAVGLGVLLALLLMGGWFRWLWRDDDTRR